MRRSSISSKKSAKIFKRTANRTRPVNLKPPVMRGGTRM